MIFVVTCVAVLVTSVISSPSVGAATTVVYSGAGPGVPRIGVIGDSTAAQIRWTNSYGPLTRFNFTFDAEACRRTLATSCSAGGVAPETVITTMRRLRGLLGDVLVVMTGYNDPSASFGAAVDAVMAEAAAQGIPKVIWLTMRVPPGSAPTSAVFAANNRTLLQKAQQYRGALQIADWSSYSAGQTSWVIADGFHLSARGAAAAAAYIADVAAQVLDGATITPSAAPVGFGAAAASPAPGWTSAFVVGADGGLYNIEFNGAAWGGYVALGGIAVSTPAAVSPSPGAVDVFIRGADDALWTRYFDGVTWGPWMSLGGVLRSAPAVTSGSPGTLDVFVRGVDYALWTRHFDGASWSPWTPLGGVLRSAPAVTSGSPGTVDVFVVGADRALWTMTFDGGAWSGWSSLGGIVTTAPSAVSVSPGTVTVLARGVDDAMWVQSRSGSWSGWSSLGGILTAAPGSASRSAGTLDVFVRGADNALWTNRFDGGWSGWFSLGGILHSSPGAVSSQAGTGAVFVRGADSALWSQVDLGNGFGGWLSLGGIVR